jgi:transposase
MNMMKLSKAIADEQKAEEFLREIGILKTFKECPYCENKHFGKVRRNFYKCYRCKREWSVRKGSILERMKIPFDKFVLALKLFELEIPVLKACKELELSYNTVHRLFMLIRKKIYRKTSEDNLLKGEVEADESYFGGKRKGKRGRGAKDKIPVFGILERRGKVKVEIVKDVKAETLLKETIRRLSRKVCLLILIILKLPIKLSIENMRNFSYLWSRLTPFPGMKLPDHHSKLNP